MTDWLLNGWWRKRSESVWCGGGVVELGSVLAGTVFGELVSLGEQEADEELEGIGD